MAMSQSGCKLTIFPAVPKANVNDQPDLNVDVVRLSLLAPRTLLRSLGGLKRNFRGALRSLSLILSAKSTLKTKLKNLALFPTGLAVADEVYERHISHLHAYWLSGVSTVALIASQVAGVDWSFTAHSGDIFLENNLIAEKLELAAFGRVISEVGRLGIIRRSGNATFHRLEVIRLGVVVPQQPRESKMNGSRTIRFLCPALFYYFKDHMSLLKALRNVVNAGLDCHCTLAGNGPLRASIKRTIHKLDLEATVTMAGMIPHQELLQQFQMGAYDAVIIASRDLEGIPVSLVEAMAAGVPCIATRVGGIPELIDNQCGILVSERSPQELAEAIITLASDPALRRKLGENARGVVLEQFNADKTARKLLSLITQRIAASS
jgi:glycosyltransferase involved in cell wall biosynthesis